MFVYKEKDDNGRRTKTQTKSIPLAISEKYQDDYEEYQFKKKLARMKKNRNKALSAKMEKLLEVSIDDEPKDKRTELEAGKQYVSQVVEAANMLGLSRPQERQGIDWDKVLPVILTGVPAILKVLSDQQANQREYMDRMLQTMLTMNNSSNNQLVEMLKTQQGVGSGNMAIKEFKDMVLGALDIKEALSGSGRETVSDKIFRMIEAVAPQVLSIAAMSKQQQLASPNYHMAKAYMEHSPEFQKLRENPQALVDLVNRLDSFYGWEQSDAILQVAGYQRPDECPRREEQRRPAGNETEETNDAETVDGFPQETGNS